MTDFTEIERLFTQADKKTQTELVALGYFMLLRRNRRSLKELSGWTRRGRLQRLYLVILGGWVYLQAKML